MRHQSRSHQSITVAPLRRHATQRDLPADDSNLNALKSWRGGRYVETAEEEAKKVQSGKG